MKQVEKVKLLRQKILSAKAEMETAMMAGKALDMFLNGNIGLHCGTAMSETLLERVCCKPELHKAVLLFAAETITMKLLDSVYGSKEIDSFAKGMMTDEDYAKNVDELLDKILGGTQ